MRKFITVAALLSLLLISVGCAPRLGTTFGGEGFGYKIDYPVDWEKDETAFEYSVTLFNEEAAINIQNLASVEMGGIYEDAEHVYNDFKRQILEELVEGKVYDEGEFVYTMESGRELTGYQFLTEYKMPDQDILYKQWQIIIPGSTETVFHTFAYNSLPETYETYLPIAEKMLKSWEIYE